jgi:hypothetical protein
MMFHFKGERRRSNDHEQPKLRTIYADNES